VAQSRRDEGLSDAAGSGKQDVVAVLQPVQFPQLFELNKAEPVRDAPACSRGVQSIHSLGELRLIVRPLPKKV